MRHWVSFVLSGIAHIRGHGRSGKPDTDEAWESKRLAEDFDAVVDAFGLCRPFVVGWSLGASHLMDILSYHPIDYVAGIVNIAGATYIYEEMATQLGTPLVLHLIHQIMLAPTVEEFQEAAAEFIDGCCRTLPYELYIIFVYHIVGDP
ncbi:hypothetical protein D9756_009054 [Leucocoprinus leucothites]|uniref:AB hydrolase-1 domain-containing protein n=1 Tax=Leucocoprinus leucothites TaxID=201217 RepID=A0A8H5CXU2_9AGAR|nr:hypothetical protein D9756_009054 [Leucoagaricus leucothites]